MKKFLFLFVFFLVFGGGGQVYAAVGVINNGFENCDIDGNYLTGWTYLNASAKSVSSYQHFGTYYAEITGKTYESGTYKYRGYISQTISYNKGDTYRFDWLFLLNDGSPLDYAYYKLGAGGEEKVFYLQGTTGPSAEWDTETITFSESGTVELIIGVVSYISGGYSQLLIDSTPVPVPASLFLLGGALLSIAASYRKL